MARQIRHPLPITRRHDQKQSSKISLHQTAQAACPRLDLVRPTWHRPPKTHWCPTRNRNSPPKMLPHSWRKILTISRLNRPLCLSATLPQQLILQDQTQPLPETKKLPRSRQQIVNHPDFLPTCFKIILRPAHVLPRTSYVPAWSVHAKEGLGAPD